MKKADSSDLARLEGQVANDRNSAINEIQNTINTLNSRVK